MKLSRAVVCMAMQYIFLVQIPSGSQAAPVPVVYQGQSQCRQIALTFDTEIDSTTPVILNVLDAYQVRSTFYMVGLDVEAYPALTNRIASTHEVGNHGYSHVPLSSHTREEIREQIELAHDAIVDATGRPPVSYLRPPFGDFNQTVLEVLGEVGYAALVHWSVAPDETTSAARTASDLLSRAFPGGIVLLHGYTDVTPPALQQALPELWRQGYQLVTVTEILGINRGARDWGGTPIHVQQGDTLERLASCYNTFPGLLAAYNNLAAEPAPGTVLTAPHRDEILIRFDGERLLFDVYPRLDGARSIAAARTIAERAGAEVTWLPETSQVEIRKGETWIRFTMGQTTALVNGESIVMDTAPRLIGGRTMVPVRFLAEHLGLQVGWQSESRTVLLSTP